MTRKLKWKYVCKYVFIKRTGVFLAVIDMDGNVHMGFDAFRKGKVFTLPGGRIERSDRNMYFSGIRESKQECGKHMRYYLIDPKPYVFLCDIDTDEIVLHPKRGQRVKMRVVWFVMEIDGHQPVEQRRKPEVLCPMAYRITEKMLDELTMRESTRIALREAFRRGHLPHATYVPGVKPDMESLRQQMLDLRVLKRIADYYGMRSVNRQTGPFDAYLKRLENVEGYQKLPERQKLRAARARELSRKRLIKLMPEISEMFTPDSASNLAYVEASEALLRQLADEFRNRAA